MSDMVTDLPDKHLWYKHNKVLLSHLRGVRSTPLNLKRKSEKFCSKCGVFVSKVSFRIKRVLTLPVVELRSWLCRTQCEKPWTCKLHSLTLITRVQMYWKEMCVKSVQISGDVIYWFDSFHKLLGWVCNISISINIWNLSYDAMTSAMLL